jgi:hypothetical protein
VLNEHRFPVDNVFREAGGLREPASSDSRDWFTAKCPEQSHRRVGLQIFTLRRKRRFLRCRSQLIEKFRRRFRRHLDVMPVIDSNSSA